MKLHVRLLSVIVPVIMLSLLSLGWVVYEQLRQQSQKQLIDQMQTVLDQTIQRTQSFTQALQANSRLFANSNLIHRYTMIQSEAERFELLQPALLQLFKSYQEAYPDYREIRLLTPTGYEDTRLAYPELYNSTEEEGDTDFFLALESGRRPFHMEVGSNADDGQPTVMLGRPLWQKNLSAPPQSADAVLGGYLVVTASLEPLIRKLTEQKIGDEGYLMVLDPEGRIVFHQQSELIGTQLPELARTIDSTGPGTVASGIQLSGTRNTLQWYPLLQQGFLLLAVVPESEFAKASHTVARLVASITILTTLLTCLMVYVLVRSLVLRPISRLRDAAIAYGDGQTDVAIDLVRKDEIGDLGRALSDMHRKLGHSLDELKHSHARIEQLAYRDALTRLPNRRLFIEMVQQAIAPEQRGEHEKAVLFLDLDDFKRVNDTLGHDAGDQLLQEVANRLKHCLRESGELTQSDEQSEAVNHVARIGGDEFIILLGALGHPDHATIVARRIIAELSRPVSIRERSFVVGTSIGIAMYPRDAEDVEGLIKCADTAMYEAKRSCKNTYRYYGAPMQESIESRLQMEEDLRNAVRRQEFELYYQPQFDTRSGLMSGTEVLLRWNHPEHGMVPPDLFIPVAEETGLIGKLGEWVLMQACAQWREWQDSGIAPQRIAVNISQRQFSLGNLQNAVDNALRASRMQAEFLELELTESCMMKAPAHVVTVLQSLRESGVRIAMDDFGTGYSSLGALTSLPIDTLKIDRSFVSGIEQDAQNSAVVSAILMLARTLNLEIVAEGVEVQAELDYLAEHECDVVQGYLLARPLPAQNMTELLQTIRDSAYRLAS